MGVIGDALGEYARPLLENSDGSVESFQKAMDLAMMCWNLSLISGELREKHIEDFRRSVDMAEDEFADFLDKVIEPMIQRRAMMFPMKGLTKLGGRPSSDDDDPASKRSNAPGRYDPCPCQSGKKYKFCCGLPRAK